MTRDAKDGHENPSEISRSDLPIGRAAFLGMIGVGLGAIFVAPSISGSVNGFFSRAIPDPISTAVSGGGWRIYSVAPPMPTLDPNSYSLSIGALVERPQTFSWPQVAALPGVEDVSDFHCVTGWSVLDVRWEGIRPATIIEMVRPLPSARYVSFISLEAPYADQISLEQFQQQDVVVARNMDGRPLKRAHGAPWA